MTITIKTKDGGLVTWENGTIAGDEGSPLEQLLELEFAPEWIAPGTPWKRENPYAAYQAALFLYPDAEISTNPKLEPMGDEIVGDVQTIDDSIDEEELRDEGLDQDQGEDPPA